ncbi:MAG: 23S rRNA (guanosine(2251)-2'-O)-methyltransferase RlmB [Treponema sp. CETP13]|nr:MAG: 23S rRNA (guanosine(2251)-2'-O)-methyltransferase RlmB [Treponema sp. CETP13]
MNESQSLRVKSLHTTVITGFHAIEERLRKAIAVKTDLAVFTIYYSKIGPRVKKILAMAKDANITCEKVENKQLDELVINLDTTAQDHRGIVLKITGVQEKQNNVVDFDTYLDKLCDNENGVSTTSSITVVLLDSVTDPHNVGAIIRSCDQLGVDLFVVPESNSPKDGEIIARSSAGANAWIPIAIVPNLTRAVQKLKSKNFWIYGADAGGEPTTKIQFAQNTALVMGSEGTGIHRLLKEKCDTIVSIPTVGKLDSLNVSVAAGILMYEVHRQKYTGISN